MTSYCSKFFSSHASCLCTFEKCTCGDSNQTQRERTGLSSSHYPGNKHGDSGTDDPADLFSKERPLLECLVNHCQRLLRKYLRKEMDLSN